MPEVIGTRVSSQLYQWMLGLPVSSIEVQLVEPGANE